NGVYPAANLAQRFGRASIIDAHCPIGLNDVSSAERHLPLEGVARQSLISSALEHIAPEIPIARCPFAFLDARRHVLHLLPGIRRMLVSVFFEKIGTIKQRADIQIERKRYQ